MHKEEGCPVLLGWGGTPAALSLPEPQVPGTSGVIA
jgi:hypothetical protein